MDDWGKTNETKETKPGTESRSEIGPKGIQSMRGGEIAEPAETKNTAVPDQSASPENNTESTPDLEFPGPPDSSDLRYELGSPHDDYQAYKDLQAAQRKHELGQQAATVQPGKGFSRLSSLGEAAANTWATHKEFQGSDETPMDDYFYKKEGRAPYTTDAYPKLTEEDQPQSYTDEDILIDEMNQLREQQEKDLQDDLEKFKNRPKPPYYKE